MREGPLLAVTGGGLVAGGHEVGVHITSAVAEEESYDRPVEKKEEAWVCVINPDPAYNICVMNTEYYTRL